VVAYFTSCYTDIHNYGIIDQQSKLCILTEILKWIVPYTNKIPSAPFVPCQNQFLAMHHSVWTTINLSPAPSHHAPQITGERLCMEDYIRLYLTNIVGILWKSSD